MCKNSNKFYFKIQQLSCKSFKNIPISVTWDRPTINLTNEIYVDDGDGDVDDDDHTLFVLQYMKTTHTYTRSHTHGVAKSRWCSIALI